MVTMLIIVGGAWALVALLFCLALAKAAAKPVPTWADDSGAHAAEEFMLSGEDSPHLKPARSMGHAA